MSPTFAGYCKPRFRRERTNFFELPYYMAMNGDGHVVNPEASRGRHSWAGRAKLFIAKSCRKVGSSLKSWLCNLASCIPLQLFADNDSFPEMPCPSMEEVERLLADLERGDLGSVDQDFSRVLQTEGTEMRALSPSLMPNKCATAPEICLWAGSLSFRAHFGKQMRAVIRHMEDDGDTVRQVAILNCAYQTRWYSVCQGMGFRYPEGTTGRKILRRKLPFGAKGFKDTRRWDSPADKDVYVPTNGVSRKPENRPKRGRWFYPQPSSLREEFKP